MAEIIETFRRLRPSTAKVQDRGGPIDADIQRLRGRILRFFMRGVAPANLWGWTWIRRWSRSAGPPARDRSWVATTESRKFIEGARSSATEHPGTQSGTSIWLASPLSRRRRRLRHTTAVSFSAPPPAEAPLEMHPFTARPRNAGGGSAPRGTLGQRTFVERTDRVLSRARRVASRLRDSMRGRPEAHPHAHDLNAAVAGCVPTAFRDRLERVPYSWGVNDFGVDDGTLVAVGWALPIGGDPEMTEILVNDEPARPVERNDIPMLQNSTRTGRMRARAGLFSASRRARGRRGQRREWSCRYAIARPGWSWTRTLDGTCRFGARSSPRYRPTSSGHASATCQIGCFF